MTESKKEEKKQAQELIANPVQIVPKFCNGVNFTALNNGQVIFTFTYKEGDQPPILIERIIVDIEHAKQTRDVLSNFLNDIEKNESSTT